MRLMEVPLTPLERLNLLIKLGFKFEEKKKKKKNKL